MKDVQVVLDVLWVADLADKTLSLSAMKSWSLTRTIVFCSATTTAKDNNYLVNTSLYVSFLFAGLQLMLCPAHHTLLSA